MNKYRRVFISIGISRKPFAIPPVPSVFCDSPKTRPRWKSLSMSSSWKAKKIAMKKADTTAANFKTPWERESNRMTGLATTHHDHRQYPSSQVGERGGPKDQFHTTKWGELPPALNIFSPPLLHNKHLEKKRTNKKLKPNVQSVIYSLDSVIYQHHSAQFLSGFPLDCGR